jgi:hypothetical protein
LKKGIYMKLPHNISKKPAHKNQGDPILMDQLITKLLKDGAVKKVQENRAHYVSPIIAIRQEDSTRLVLNTVYLNNITPPSFRLPSRDAPRHWIQKNDKLGKIDYKSAYHQLSLHRKIKKFFVFHHNGAYYQYEVLPQGWNMSPYIWTRYANRLQHFIAEQKIRSCIYMDDALIADSPDTFDDTIQRVLHTWRTLGVFFSTKKCVISGSSSLDFLGYNFSTENMSIRLTKTKKTKILTNLRRLANKHKNKKITRLDLLRSTGLLLAFIEAIPNVKIHLRTLINYQAKQAQDQLPLTAPLSTPLEWDGVLDDLRQKIKNQSQTALAPHKQVQLTTDSSGHAWGAILQTKRKRKGLTTQGFWNDSESRGHINWKETLTLKKAIQRFNLQKTHIIWHTDNMTSKAMVMKFGTSKSIPLNDVAMEIQQLLQNRSLTISAFYVKSKDNLADLPSRTNLMNHWKTSPQMWTTIQNTTHITPSLDLFPSPNQAEFLPPPFKHHNSLDIPWTFPNTVYIFPPPALLPAVISKVSRDQTKGVLISPTWPTKTWWSVLNKENWINHGPLLPKREPVLDSEDRPILLTHTLTIWSKT